MTDSSDYISAMPTPLTISEDDAEILLNGVEPIPDEFAELAHALTTLKAEGEPQPGDDYSALIAAAAMESALSPIEQFANLQITITDDWTARVVRRVTVGAAALFLLVAGTTGMAYAANGAGPGDLLYGLDRAMEVVGIGDGGAVERITEAQALVAAGEVPEGLIHAAGVVAATPAGELGAPAIQAAAQRMEGTPVGPDSHVSDAVEELLGYIHGLGLEEGAEGVEGQMVAALAHKIGNGPPEVAGESGTTPPGPPELAGESGSTPPGPPELAGESGSTESTSDGGPPEDPGKPDDTPGVGPEGEPGKPEDTPGGGPPEEVGSTESTSDGGPPEDPGKPEDTPSGPEDPGKPEDTPGGPPGQGGGG